MAGGVPLGGQVASVRHIPMKRRNDPGSADLCQDLLPRQFGLRCNSWRNVVRSKISVLVSMIEA